jgi:hypothetical protein
MKIVPYPVYIVLVPFLIIFGCSADNQSDDDFLLQVNNFRMSTEAFNSQLKFETEVDSSFHLSEKTRAEFMKNLIQTQLLVQEAKKHKLDEREKFRKTIERYWESTLIRDLISQKSDEIRSHTVVSEEEVKAYGDRHKDLLVEQSVEDRLPEIRKNVEDEKVARQLENWINGLKDSAKIQINDQKLHGMMEGKANR